MSKSKLEQAAENFCQKEKDLTITFSYDTDDRSEVELPNIAPNSRSIKAFKEGAKWLLSEAKRIWRETPVAAKFENMNEFHDRKVRIADLVKLTEEE